MSSTIRSSIDLACFWCFVLACVQSGHALLISVLLYYMVQVLRFPQPCGFDAVLKLAVGVPYSAHSWPC